MPWWTCLNCMNNRGPDEIYTLDFSHHLLHDVPADVFAHERTLEELHLNSNRISDLPRQLFYCQELRTLNLQDNDIAAIPPAISSLTNLQKINLSKNALTTLVDNIKACKHLFHLDLSLNNLIKLPDAVTSLISIQELYLNDIFLEYLPANFGRLVNLRILELRDNNLSTLPKSMARLTNLTRIDIGHNEFTELPEVIGQLVNLTELWLDNNRIRRISANVGNLKKLVHFEASNNQLSHLPNEISNWGKLQELSISVNDFKNLPFSIGMMKSLVTIKADENNLQELPDSICQLENLEEIMISHNDLFRLPPSIGLLRKLRFLTADENLIRHLPNELCSCIALTILSVRGNKLTEIPPDIGHLINLRVINIVNNFITYLPVSVLNLTQLSALWISDNQSQPLMPLQKEYGAEQSVHLTCFMLPQTNATPTIQKVNGIKHGQTLKQQQQQQHQQMLADASKRRICFASDPVISIEQTGRLMRSPTPYPKELRVLAKYARYIQKTGESNDAALDNYTESDEIQSTKNPESSSIEIKEARVTSNSSLLLNPQHSEVSPNGGSVNYNAELEQSLVEYQPLLVQQHPQLLKTFSYSQSQSQPINGLRQMAVPLNSQHIPLLNDDTDSKTVNRPYYYPDRKYLDYENMSVCSSNITNQFGGLNGGDDIKPRNLYGNAVEYNSGKEEVGLRMSQASSFGDESLSSAFSDQRQVLRSSFYNNNVQQLPPAAIIPNNQFYQSDQQIHYHQQLQPQAFHQQMHYQTISSTASQENGYDPYAYTNGSSQQWQTVTQNRLSTSESLYGSNTPDQLVPKQPPPYHIAKAFTKKSEKDLLIYDNYRSSNGTENQSTIERNGLIHQDTNIKTDNLQNIHHASNSLQQQQPQHESFDDTADTNSINYNNQSMRKEPNQDHDSNLNESTKSDDNQSVHSNSLSTTTNSRKSPWLFGPHKNPKVLQFNVPKNPDVGFKISENQKYGGIFISDVSIDSSANGMLQKMDKVLDVDGIDFTRISIKEALTVLSNSGPVMNIMISRT